MYLVKRNLILPDRDERRGEYSFHGGRGPGTRGGAGGHRHRPGRKAPRRVQETRP